MVSLPSEAATDAQLVQNLVEAGMDLMRINCAHDGPVEWAAIVDNLGRAEQTLGWSCRVAMDLAGPKSRTGALRASGRVQRLARQRDCVGRLARPGRVWLTPAEAAEPTPRTCACAWRSAAGCSLDSPWVTPPPRSIAPSRPPSSAPVLDTPSGSTISLRSRESPPAKASTSSCLVTSLQRCHPSVRRSAPGGCTPAILRSVKSSAEGGTDGAHPLLRGARPATFLHRQGYRMAAGLHPPGTAQGLFNPLDLAPGQCPAAPRGAERPGPARHRWSGVARAI